MLVNLLEFCIISKNADQLYKKIQFDPKQIKNLHKITIKKRRTCPVKIFNIILYIDYYLELMQLAINLKYFWNTFLIKQ